MSPDESSTANKISGRGKQRTSIAVDLDGVIADYEGWQDNNTIGPPRKDVIYALGVLRERGWKIIVHTARGEKEVNDYLSRENIPFDEINANSDYSNRGTKPVATVYWDDRALRYSGDAARDLKFILDFKTWNGRD